MSEKTMRQESQEFSRKNSLLNLENFKNSDSFNNLLTMISNGTQKNIPEELEQKAIRILKSNKCNCDNLTNFTPDQVEEYYLQLVKNFQLVEYRGPTIIDPHQTKNLYLVLFGEVNIFTQHHNEETEISSPERRKAMIDYQTIKSLLNLNLHEEGEITRNVTNIYQNSQVATTSQEDFLFKNFDVYKKLFPGSLFGDVKQIPELPKNYLAHISENAVLAEISKQDLEKILKVNQLKKLFPNVNNKSIIQLSKNLVSKYYVKDQIIYSEGNESDCIYIIREGQVTFVKSYFEIIKPLTDQLDQEGQEDENSHSVLMKHKVFKNQIELSKVSVGQMFGEDEIFLGTLRNNTAKVSSIGLDAYILKKEQLFQFINMVNSHSNQNSQNYIENMKSHYLKKQDFYEKRIVINMKKIQNIVENQRKTNSPLIQRGLSGILNDSLQQKSPQETQSFFKTTQKFNTSDNVLNKQQQNQNQHNQNNKNISHENNIKNQHPDLIQTSKDQSDGQNQLESTTQNKQQTSIKPQNNFYSQIQRIQKINKQANQKQVSTTDEIQQLVTNNQLFMKKAGQNQKKFGFENPLFEEVAQNQIQRIRQINEDYQKLKDPKKYKEKPMHQKNQIIQKRMTKILDLTIRKQLNGQQPQQDSKDADLEDENNKLKELSINIASPRIQGAQLIASLNNFISSPTQSITNLNNNQTNISNTNNPNTKINGFSNGQSIPAPIRFSFKNKFLQHSDSPTSRQVDQSDSPIQVNSLISSYRESPMNRNQSEKKAGLTFSNFQQSAQRNEVQVQNSAPSQSKFSQEARHQMEQENNFYKQEYNQRKIDDCRTTLNPQKSQSKEQKTPEKRQHEEYQTQPLLRKVSIKNISEEKQSQTQIYNQKQKQSLQIKIPQNEYCDVQQYDEQANQKQNQSIYYLNHCSKNRNIVRKSFQQLSSHDVYAKQHPHTTVSTPSNHINQKLSFNNLQDANLSLSNTPFHIPKNLSFAKKKLLLDGQEESNKNFQEKRYREDTFSQVLLNSQTHFYQNIKTPLADNQQLDQLNNSNNNQQTTKQQFLQNSKSMNQMSGIFRLKSPQIKNNYFQKQNNILLQNTPQSHLIFYKNSNTNNNSNSNLQSQSQTFQTQSRILFKNAGHFSHRVDSSLVSQIQSPKNKQQIQNEIVNYHMQNKKLQNKAAFLNQSSQLLSQKSGQTQNHLQAQPPNSPLSNEKKALYKIVNNLN